MITSFAPRIAPDSRVLVLGSVPGEASLAAGRYYAHPRNAFWPIIHSLFGGENDYLSLCDTLARNGITLWDVLKSCEREGSLDQSIRHPVPNDIQGLLKDNPGIHSVCLNGGAALQYYRRYCKHLPLAIHPLPSTSPANARLTLQEKRKAWSILLELCRKP